MQPVDEQPEVAEAEPNNGGDEEGKHDVEDEEAQPENELDEDTRADALFAAMHDDEDILR